MALSDGNHSLERRSGKVLTLALAASVTAFAGAIAVVASNGFVRPGRVNATDKAIGVFKDTKAGGAVDGTEKVEIENDGWYLFKNSSAGDLIAVADIESPCYIVDDETVAKTHATNTRSKCGIIKDVSAAGVWVKVGFA